MLGVTRQDLLGQNPSLGYLPLAEIEIRQTGFEGSVIRILLQFTPDLFFGFSIFPTLLQESDRVELFGERCFPFRLQASLGTAMKKS
jgi:hypothetical protein